MRHKTLRFLIVMSLVPLVIAPFLQPVDVLFNGLKEIFLVRDVLITDYIAVGGIGAALLNVGIVSLLSVLLIVWSKADINGTAIASVFLMGSFAFFGKNAINTLPILAGTFVYARVTKEPYKDIVHISLLATSFAPIFTELYMFGHPNQFVRLITAILVGMSAGFVIKPVSRHMLKIHEGFNLYNTGFAIGILSTIFVSVMKSFGYQPETQLILDTSHSHALTISLAVMFTAFVVGAFVLDHNVHRKYWKLLHETGYGNNDFLVKFGLPTVLLNMAMNGFLVLAYLLFIAQAHLSGPVIGGIFTVLGFSGAGKHIRNVTPILLGVMIGSVTSHWSLGDPSIVLVALFGTALAPIAGYFGFFYGVVASFLNSSVVLNLSHLHGGLNLYNTGFSSGIVAAFYVPILRKFVKPHSEE